jgi:hypothetical protein
MTRGVELSDSAAPILAGTRSRPIGRLLRFLMGASMVALIVPEIARASLTKSAMVGGVILALLGGYTLIHLAVWRFAPELNRWLGALLAVTPAALLFLFGGAIGQIASVGYIGGSLLLDGINGDAGCEVMAVPGMLLNRRTHLACLVFSPLDWLESKLFG